MTVNSDDPAYFGGYVADNYLAVQQALGLSVDDTVQLARNSIEASWLLSEEKQHWQDRITVVAAREKIMAELLSPLLIRFSSE